ncbi:YceI family protein [Balneola sp. MJW-20]|uniref:YceI family protein n=1 Tax=Gracilimonas aurantiaca TaxID=3234185 RepID=UPI003465184D
MTLISSPLIAQTYTIAQPESEVTISGTSTLHDWESVAEEFTGEATFTMEDGSLTGIQSLVFTVVVDQIKSGKGMMDKKTKGALKEKKNPEITFNLSEVSEMSADSIMANGELTIAGVTKTVQIKAAYMVNDDGSVTFNGTQPINMTDYEVDPPTAMLGSIKTGEDVQVHFAAKFIQ